MTDATMAPASPERDWMTTDEFKAWYARLGLSEAELARRLDTTQVTINRWRNGRRTPPGFLYLALERLEQVLADERKPKRRQPRRRAGAGGEGE